jgi:hypothetical protein
MPPRKQSPRATAIKDTQFTVSEPRYVPRKDSPPTPRITLFAPPPSPDPVYVAEELSHAIYDIEIANSNALRMEKK